MMDPLDLYNILLKYDAYLSKVNQYIKPNENIRGYEDKYSSQNQKEKFDIDPSSDIKDIFKGKTICRICDNNEDFSLYYANVKNNSVELKDTLVLLCRNDEHAYRKIYECIRRQLAHCIYEDDGDYLVFDSKEELYLRVSYSRFQKLIKEITHHPSIPPELSDEECRLFWNELIVKHPKLGYKREHYYYPESQYFEFEEILNKYFPGNWKLYKESEIDECHNECNSKKIQLPSDNMLLFYKKEFGLPPILKVFKYFRDFAAHYYSFRVKCSHDFICFDILDKEAPQNKTVAFVYIKRTDIQPFIMEMTSLLERMQSTVQK